ncbi:hypothetical protein R6Q57_014213 [Mikania cordata]
MNLISKMYPYTCLTKCLKETMFFLVDSWYLLVVKTTHLESEKMQKEAEVQKLMDENMKLSALLDKKEAQLLAMSEQCKVMALSASNI